MYTERKKRKWTMKLVRGDNGETIEHEVESYWKDDRKEEIGNAGRAEVAASFARAKVPIALTPGSVKLVKT